MGAGAMRAGKAVIEFALSDKDVVKGLKAIEHRVAKAGQTFTQLGTKAAAMGAAIAAPLLACVKIAADAREGLAKFKAVFGEQADAADAFAQSMAEALGRSVHDIRGAMSAYQAFFVGLGFGGETAREMSQQLQTLALDFAAFHNLSDEEAMSRFISAMSGSSEVLDQFGVNTKAAAINAELLRMGLGKTTANATEQEKTLARLHIVLRAMTEQGGLGAAARESDSFANKSKALKAKLDELAVTVGEQLLPRVLELTQKGIDMADAVNKWAAENPELAKTLGDVALGLVAAGGAMGGLGIALGLLTPLLNPASLLVVALAADIYGFADGLKTAADESKTLEQRLMAILNTASPLLGVLQKLGLLKSDFMKGGLAMPQSAGPGTSGAFPDAAGFAGVASKGVGAKIAAMPGQQAGAAPAATVGASLGAQLAGAGANIWDQMRRDWLTMQTEQQSQRFQEQRTIEDEIAREKINAIEDQAQREKALVEFEKNQRLRELRESGLLTPEMEAKINELFGLKAAAAGAIDEATPTAGGGREAVAILDATFASQQFGGRSKEIDLLGKIASNTDPKNNPGGVLFN